MLQDDNFDTMLSLAEIKTEVDRMAGMLGASGRVLPTYGKTEDFARPHIEVDSQNYHYVIVERGNELSRVSTGNLDELLYHVFKDITFSLAMNYEVSHRNPLQDCRRILFNRQVELLAMLSPAWAEREAKEHERILRENPFNDKPALNAAFQKLQKWFKS